ncbi:hypothetical protein QOT17_010848 [Balamuthia mandrillaris]
MQPKTSLKRKRDAHDDEEDKAGEQPNRPRLFEVTVAVPQRKPAVSQPVEVASYGIDETGQRRYGAKDMLRRLRRDIPLPLNLNEGLESFVPKDSSKDTLDHVLATLLHRNIPLSGVDFVSYRNSTSDSLLSSPLSSSALCSFCFNSPSLPNASASFPDLTILLAIKNRLKQNNADSVREAKLANRAATVERNHLFGRVPPGRREGAYEPRAPPFHLLWVQVRKPMHNGDPRCRRHNLLLFLKAGGCQC